ncbi:hypothetical protein Ssi03_11880 [Sphaerisporangium siamense]|uniref:Htaa domain protein n=1 Tax=Sphaerisporangium siamense TaxID=795645 RepID=A0A7W7DAK6_9ACTN|nr:hypothetical protein [Sphaerisporangium siamense]MBB4703036.1 hypothetical protein [Sphaerisporangium siamense]GII83198.1 hypothetical protein Ssi03_11880 [Sphaerisporangium siamense]
MFQRMRAVVVAVAMSAGALALVSSPASATAVAAPEVTSVDVGPSPVVVENKDGRPVTFSFLVDGATSGGFTLKRPDGSTVDVEAKKAGEVGGKQKWEGTRTFGRADAPGTWNVTAKATSVVGTGKADKDFQVRQVWETDLAGFGAWPEPVSKGGTLRVRGRLLVNGTGGWRPYAGQKVFVAFRAYGAPGYERVASDRTDRGGRFALGVKALRTGWWRAEYDGSDVAHKTVSDSDRVDVRATRAHSRIAGFRVAPNPATEGARLVASGRLEASRGWGGYGGQKVDLLFRADGSHRWRHVSSGRTDRGGRFRIAAEAERSGWYRAEYDGSRHVRGTSGPAVHVKVARHTASTRIVRSDSSPEPVRYGRYVTSRGVLQIWNGHDYEGYAHQKVALYFKRAGGAKWEYVKTVSTGGSGAFRAQAKAWRSGDWRVVFAGNDEARPSSGKADFVKVRK